MTIRNNATKKALAETYKELGAFFGVTKGDPGNDAQPAHEPDTGGSHTYRRVPSNWTVNDSGVATGSVTIDVDDGTYTHAILCQGIDGANMIDSCMFPSAITMNGGGQIVLNPVFKQS
ncbi:MAG: hypothetical protein QOH60_5089 [Mycobacterium sp.]|jgi:hypothetical protein|nr:hypothetical protein [Mycobacterium sp.]